MSDMNIVFIHKLYFFNLKNQDFKNIFCKKRCLENMLKKTFKKILVFTMECVQL